MISSSSSSPSSPTSSLSSSSTLHPSYHSPPLTFTPTLPPTLPFDWYSDHLYIYEGIFHSNSPSDAVLLHTIISYYHQSYSLFPPNHSHQLLKGQKFNVLESACGTCRIITAYFSLFPPASSLSNQNQNHKNNIPNDNINIHFYGFDRSLPSLSYAKERISHSNCSDYVTLYHDDINRFSIYPLPSPSHYHFLSLLSSTFSHFMKKEEVDSFFDLMSNSLQTGGISLFNVALKKDNKKEKNGNVNEKKAQKEEEVEEMESGIFFVTSKGNIIDAEIEDNVNIEDEISWDSLNIHMDNDYNSQDERSNPNIHENQMNPTNIPINDPIVKIIQYETQIIPIPIPFSLPSVTVPSSLSPSRHYDTMIVDVKERKKYSPNSPSPSSFPSSPSDNNNNIINTNHGITHYRCEFPLSSYDRWDFILMVHDTLECHNEKMKMKGKTNILQGGEAEKERCQLRILTFFDYEMLTEWTAEYPMREWPINQWENKNQNNYSPQGEKEEKEREREKEKVKVKEQTENEKGKGKVKGKQYAEMEDEDNDNGAKDIGEYFFDFDILFQEAKKRQGKVKETKMEIDDLSISNSNSNSCLFSSWSSVNVVGVLIQKTSIQ